MPRIGFTNNSKPVISRDFNWMNPRKQRLPRELCCTIWNTQSTIDLGTSSKFKPCTNRERFGWIDSPSETWSWCRPIIPTVNPSLRRLIERGHLWVLGPSADGSSCRSRKSLRSNSGITLLTPYSIRMSCVKTCKVCSEAWATWSDWPPKQAPVESIRANWLNCGWESKAPTKLHTLLKALSPYCHIWSACLPAMNCSSAYHLNW